MTKMQQLGYFCHLKNHNCSELSYFWDIMTISVNATQLTLTGAGNGLAVLYLCVLHSNACWFLRWRAMWCCCCVVTARQLQSTKSRYETWHHCGWGALGAGSWRSRCQQSWFLLRPCCLACGRPSSPCPHRAFSLCLSMSSSSLLIRTPVCIGAHPVDVIFTLKKIFFVLIYLLAALGLYCYERTFSTCGEWGLLSSCRLLISVASLVVEHRL